MEAPETQHGGAGHEREPLTVAKEEKTANVIYKPSAQHGADGRLPMAAAKKI